MCIRDRHRTLSFEIRQPHPAIFAQRFGIIGQRQGEQGQLILPNLDVYKRQLLDKDRYFKMVYDFPVANGNLKKILEGKFCLLYTSRCV